MFSFIYKPKGLNTILSSFQKTLADLDKLVTKNTALYQANAATVAALHAENRELSDETAQAERVAARIKELVA